MILYDGVYEWDGKSHSGEAPICWWPGSYRIRIVNLSSMAPDVLFLKTHAVIFKNKGKGTYLKNYIQNFAKKISAQYNLIIEKTLWVEVANKNAMEPGTIKIANLECITSISGNKLYAASWRPERPNELKLLTPWMQGFR